MTTLLLKRAYEAASPADGFRVYVDRLWPRGLSHEDFPYDSWDKEIAPSDSLRHWFHDTPGASWNGFETAYIKELEGNPGVAALAEELKPHPVATLLYSSRNEEENNAVVLRDYLLNAYPSSFH